MVRTALLLSLLAAAVSADATNTRVQFFGDSTMVAAGTLLRARLGEDADVRAVSGTRADTLLQQWPEVPPARIRVFNFGMNDAKPEALVPIAAYKEHLRNLVSRPGAEAVLETPNPSIKPGWDSAPYAQAMREVGAELGVRVIDVHACFQEQPRWQERLPDGVHPDTAGLRHIVDTCVLPGLAK